MRHARDTAHKQQRSQHDPDADGDHHIKQHRQRHAHQHHHDVVLRRVAQQIDDFMRLTHVPCHHQQQGGHRRQRQPGEQWGEDQQRQDHQQGVDHGGNRRCGAGADVRRRAGNRRGGSDPAEERRDNVAQPLANQLAIGFVLGAGHAIKHHRAQQRFNGAEHRH